MWLDYFIFGIIDNFIMIVGAFTGVSVERFLPDSLQRGLGGILGAGIGNTLSDFLGGVGAGNMELAIFTGLGCIVGLIFIPIFYILLKNKSIDNETFK